jgi:hypothetical protein
MSETKVKWSETTKLRISSSILEVELREAFNGPNKPRGLEGVLLRCTGNDGQVVEATTDADGVAGFDVKVPATIVCPLPGAAGAGTSAQSATAMNSFSPVQRPAKVPPPDSSLARCLHLIRKVELATGWTNKEVLGALRKLAGYDDPNWQTLLSLPEQRTLVPVAADWGQPAGPPNFVVEWKEVREGSIETIAKANGLSASQLGLFNWNTAVDREIERFLGGLSGARSTERNGKYVLRPSDNPGGVLVPTEWKVERLDAGHHTIDFHPCVPGWTSLLTADEILELRHQFLAHATDGELDDESGKFAVTFPGHKESGIGTDRHGRFVGLGHVLTGIAAGVDRHKSVDLALSAGCREGGFGWLLRCPAGLVIGAELDNLYTATLAGDLGQEAVLHIADKEPKGRKSMPYVGHGTECTEAEGLGDIDGFLLGHMLSDGGQGWLQKAGLSRRFPATMRVSELLERFYGDRADMKFSAGNVGMRFALFRDATTNPPATLEDQTIRFAKNYIYSERGPGKLSGSVTFVTDDCQKAIAEFNAWLAKQTDKP